MRSLLFFVNYQKPYISEMRNGGGIIETEICNVR